MRALAFLLVLTVPQAASAQVLGLDPLADRFAACAGRLAGLMEHQWLAGDPATGATEARLEAMRDLVTAVLPPGKAAAALARETEAKLAWERLMRRAENGDGARDAEDAGPDDHRDGAPAGRRDGGDGPGATGPDGAEGWARARAEAEIRTCTQLLLP